MLPISCTGCPLPPPWPVSLDLSGSLNPEEGKFETTNARLNASYKDIASFSLGYTFSSGANQESVIGELDLAIVEGTRLSYLGRYDAERGVFTENKVGLIYQTCCWALSIIYTHRDTENPDDPKNDIRFNFELLTAPSQRID